MAAAPSLCVLYLRLLAFLSFVAGLVRRVGFGLQIRAGGCRRLLRVVVVVDLCRRIRLIVGIVAASDSFNHGRGGDGAGVSLCVQIGLIVRDKGPVGQQCAQAGLVVDDLGWAWFFVCCPTGAGRIFRGLRLDLGCRRRLILPARYGAFFFAGFVVELVVLGCDGRELEKVVKLDETVIVRRLGAVAVVVVLPGIDLAVF